MQGQTSRWTLHIRVISAEGVGGETGVPTEETHTPHELDGARALAAAATLTHDAADDVVKHAERERDPRPAGENECSFILAEVDTAPAVWAVDHHLYGNFHGRPVGLFVFVLLEVE